MGNTSYTRKMDMVLTDLEEKFKNLYTKEDFERVFKKLEKSYASERPSVRAEIYSMLKDCGVTCSPDMTDKEYKKVSDSLKLFTNDEIGDRIFEAIFEKFSLFLSPKDYMLRIVDRVDKEFTKDPLRLRILKRFVKHTNSLSDAGYNGNHILKYAEGKTGKEIQPEQLADYLDDGVFEPLSTATKAQKKPYGIYGILKLCNDLAEGNFRGEGATREGLYLFGIAFEMTYTPAETRKEHKENDIEKNLFYDYYSNNVIRFIGEEYRKNASGCEIEPTGQGINYKNFAEMVYLYYIGKNLTPLEKIKKATAMIERISKECYSTEKTEKPVKATEILKESFLERVFTFGEEEFEKFIKTEYNCNIHAGFYERKQKNGEKSVAVENKYSEFQLEPCQETAFKAYLEIIEKIKEGGSLENCVHGIWFVDTDDIKNRYKELLSSMKGTVAEKDDFAEVIVSADKFLKNKNGKNKALYINSSDKITRTSMLVAYYYYYCQLREDGDENKWRSFKNVFDDFRQGLNGILDKCAYQQISGKNIFDIIIVFSAYAYINM